MTMPTVDLVTDQLVPFVYDTLSDFGQIGYSVFSIELFKIQLVQWTWVEKSALELMLAYDDFLALYHEMIEVLVDECMITADYARTLYKLYMSTVCLDIRRTCHANYLPIVVTDTIVCVAFEQDGVRRHF